jgi:hypothetical protein
MNQITTLTDAASQQLSIALDDGTIATFSFTYLSAIQRWTFYLSHPLLTLAGMTLSAHPNVLRAWRNVIPFGLACTSLDGIDPVDISDFANGRVQIYILNAADVAQVETDILGASV